jgi:hypothetical protein
VGAQIAGRQQGLDPTSSLVRGRRSRACAAALRRLAARRTSTNVVVAAIARELAGFLWAEMTA